MEIKEYVKYRKQILTETINDLEVKPHLLIIQVNKDEASNAYVKGKKKDLELIGARCTHLELSLDITEQELLNVIKMNNYNDDVDGILVQMPLPKHIDEAKVKETINPCFYVIISMVLDKVLDGLSCQWLQLHFIEDDDRFSFV